MKPSIWYLALVVVAGLFMHNAIAQSIDGFSKRQCPTCVKKGYKTKVYVGSTSCTLMAAIAYYDENGEFVYNDPNWSTTSCHCSSGHIFTVQSSRANQIVNIINSNDAPYETGAFGISCGSFTNTSTNRVVTNLTSNTDFTISSIHTVYTNANYILNSSTTEWKSVCMFTGEFSRASERAVWLYEVEFGTSNGVLYCNPHGQSMTQSASNVLKFIVEQYKQMGYKLTQ